jgi:hypothetical protein
VRPQIGLPALRALLTTGGLADAHSPNVTNSALKAGYAMPAAARRIRFAGLFAGLFSPVNIRKQGSFWLVAGRARPVHGKQRNPCPARHRRRLRTGNLMTGQPGQTR